MKVCHFQEIPAEPVRMDGASGVNVRWLIGEKDGAPNFAMRHFEIEPGGCTPHHQHPYEHEIFVLEGDGVALAGDKPIPFKPGDSIYVPPNELHQFRNTGTRPVRVICMVPSANRCT